MSSARVLRLVSGLAVIDAAGWVVTLVVLSVPLALMLGMCEMQLERVWQPGKEGQRSQSLIVQMGPGPHWIGWSVEATHMLGHVAYRMDGIGRDLRRSYRARASSMNTFIVIDIKKIEYTHLDTRRARQALFQNSPPLNLATTSREIGTEVTGMDGAFGSSTTFTTWRAGKRTGDDGRRQHDYGDGMYQHALML